MGVTATYSGSPKIPPRRRGLRYKLKDVDRAGLIPNKLRREIIWKRMFLCNTKMISLEESIEATPTTAVGKKILIDQ